MRLTARLFRARVGINEMIFRKDQDPRQISLRITHPRFFRDIWIAGVGQIVLAINYWRFTPTFNPYGIPKNLVGAAFFMLGVSLLLLLLVWRSRSKLRSVLSASVFFTVFWGIANTQQVFNGNASFALPIMFGIVAAFEISAVIGSPSPTVEHDLL